MHCKTGLQGQRDQVPVFVTGQSPVADHAKKSSRGTSSSSGNGSSSRRPNGETARKIEQVTVEFDVMRKELAAQRVRHDVNQLRKDIKASDSQHFEKHIRRRKELVKATKVDVS